VSAIVHNPRNPREDYADVGELADSIRQAGITSPLGVVRYETYLTHYPDYEHEIGAHDWVVLNGNRRLAAARKVGLAEVPVYVLDHLGRDEQMDEALLIDNIHQQALPPLMEAKLLKELTGKHGSQTAVADRIGKSEGYVSQRVSLLRLTEPFQDALRRDEISIRDARRIAKAAPANQQEMWEEIQAEATVQPSGDLYPVKSPAEGRESSGETKPGRSRRNGDQHRQPIAVEKRAEQLRAEYSQPDLERLATLLVGS
jgi:ParB family chromosome partitioning protein